jgi:hypothetical protein
VALGLIPSTAEKKREKKKKKRHRVAKWILKTRSDPYIFSYAKMNIMRDSRKEIGEKRVMRG